MAITILPRWSILSETRRDNFDRRTVIAPNSSSCNTDCAKGLPDYDITPRRIGPRRHHCASAGLIGFFFLMRLGCFFGTRRGKFAQHHLCLSGVGMLTTNNNVVLLPNWRIKSPRKSSKLIGGKPSVVRIARPFFVT